MPSRIRTLSDKTGFFNILRWDKEFQLMIVVATTLWVYTSIIKLPFVVPSNYSDVGYLWFRDIYLANHTAGIPPVPYVQYNLEYPAIIGAIIWLGQAIGRYAPIIVDQYNTYMVAESVLQYPFMIGTLYNTYLLCGKLGYDRRRIYLYMLTSLTFLIYGFYNWDFIVAYFVSLAIWFYLGKRYDASALAVTAGILSKFIPICMVPAMVWCLPNNRARIRFSLIAAATWGPINALFAIADYWTTGNYALWLQTFLHTSGHQLQNTWISMVISAAGLGDIVSGRNYGHILSLAIIGYLILRSLVQKTSPLNKILLSWYAWYGAIYLFDPQMVIQLFPIIIITPDFNFILYRIADLLNGFIILFYFIGGNNPQLPKYLTEQLAPFGLVNTSAAIRQLIVLGGYFMCFNAMMLCAFIGRRRQIWLRRALRRALKPLIAPLRPTSSRERARRRLARIGSVRIPQSRSGI